MWCLKNNQKQDNFKELLDRAVFEYNSSIHSVTNKRPLDVFFGRNITTDPECYEKSRQNNIEKIRTKQAIDLEHHNKERKKILDYNIGQEIFVKQNSRLESKLTA